MSNMVFHYMPRWMLLGARCRAWGSENYSEKNHERGRSGIAGDRSRRARLIVEGVAEPPGETD